MPQRLALIAVATGIALVLAAPAAPRTADLDACSLISTGQVGSILGFAHVKILRDISGTTSRDNIAGVTHSVCNGVAWNGAPTATPAGVRAALANGTGAGFAIDTWAPDESSAYVTKWTSKGFPNFEIALATFATALQQPSLPAAFTPFHPHALLTGGKNTTVDLAHGVTATALIDSRIRITEGTWLAPPSSAAVSIGIEDAAGDRSVAQLNKIAKIAVSAFGLAPLTLR